MMKRTLCMGICAVALLYTSSAAQHVDERRAAPVAPDGYAPASVPCPSPRPTIRHASGLSDEEKAWLPLRDNETAPALRSLLGRLNISGFDATTYINSIVDDIKAGKDKALLPRVAVAVSGGGYRALMNGAGALAAFDNRTANSTGQGQLGGLLQASTYLSGLSGGSWLVGSLYVQNFTTVESIVSSTSGFLSTLWQFDNSIINGPAGLRPGQYYNALYQSVNDKIDAGFNTTITDYWGRALSYQLVNATDGGPAYTFSSIANDTDFSRALAPLPLIVALERAPGQLQVPANATVFEFNPWEMGSYDAGAAAFAPLKYVASNFSNGAIPRQGECIAGLDNAGFVMGTSSSLFNQAFLQIGKASGVPDVLTRVLNRTLAGVGEDNEDIASWPNPFLGFNARDNINADARLLTLVDGGEALENIPLHPLLLRERHVDTILAVDGSADTMTYWPNGTAMVATFNKSISGSSPNTSSAFPPVPDQNTFVNLGLNSRPTFFGCGNTSTPLIVYLPNTPYTTLSNVSTFDLSYNDSQRDQIVQNGYNVATMGNGTIDPDWPQCVACAILSRSFARTGTEVPVKCVDCFTKHCWNGTTNSTEPSLFQPQQVIVAGGGAKAMQPSVLAMPALIFFITALMLI
ncbi:Lysophospholipase [Purpureocillium takamizusanense]|uniref:Lysophospholipase n=1 Tax=Purpureocillium takamizusanense TaxID=2060973 RepID=A0A9Q8QIM0_9HYPO|nr:Lysophospholipase [Purpureocillium takamizusanense]UNI19499.1 Lysophospholipase [Purpureocillium takamizusanense]